jgi:hypothetical protein
LPSISALTSSWLSGSVTFGSIATRKALSETIFAFASCTAASIVSARTERP